MAVEDDHAPPLESREPSVEDLVDLCRELNHRGAKYIVIGGFAVRAAGYDRRTMDIDLLVDSSKQNERRVIDAVATLPDHAAREIAPGDIARYTVVRVADEIVVDLMRSASGIDYAQAVGDVVHREIDGVPIPFASVPLLWRMKRHSLRDKDVPDIHFLRLLLESRDAGDAHKG